MSVTLQNRGARTQVRLADEPFQVWSFPDGTVWTSFHRLERRYLLRFPALADFDVSEDGKIANVWPVPGVSDGTVEHLYLNQILPLALSRHGQVVLHASAVEIAGNGVAFIGSLVVANPRWRQASQRQAHDFSLTTASNCDGYTDNAGLCRVTPRYVCGKIAKTR